MAASVPRLISVDSAGRTFQLHTATADYVIHVMDGRFVAHAYWGAALPDAVPPAVDTLFQPGSPPYLAVVGRGERPTDGEFPLAPDGYSPDTLPQEYPAWGSGDQRMPALQVVHPDGSSALRLNYVEHEVVEHPVFPEGLPALRADHELGDAATLRLRIADPRGACTVDLYYVVAARSGALFRWTRVSNTGAEGALDIVDPASASFDLPADRYHLLTMSGAWARERQVVRTPLTPGAHRIGSRSGASGHQSSPFFAVCDPETSERAGRVFAAALLYSGSFAAECEVDQYGACRSRIGLQCYRAHIAPGDHRDTPVAALVWTHAGFGGMSDVFHHLVRSGITPSHGRRGPRKTIINSWEAMYFDISHEKIVTLARRGREIGAELLILDDGWFSNRRDAGSSLGDWWTNRNLFPNGLGEVAADVRAEGLDFGIWIEPEMVSPDSELFRAHPDWALQVPGLPATLARRQLTLDLSNHTVREHVYDSVAAVLRESTASYVKWDMNRAMTEAGSPAAPAAEQGEVMHRYILGLYEVLERLTAEFPEVVFEGCAGGGGRFDLGLARYSPRFWTSDQTDAIERLDVQYGTTLVFPPEMVGAHVSSVPNHQVGRTTPAWTRVVGALAFSYGYELDPAREPAEDLKVFRRGSQLARRIRGTAMHGRFVRLGSGSGAGGAGAPAERSGPGGARDARAWMVVSADAGEVFVFYIRPLARSNVDLGHLRLVDLPREAVYVERATDRRYSAAQLTGRGLWLGPARGDFDARLWHLVRDPDISPKGTS